MSGSGGDDDNARNQGPTLNITVGGDAKGNAIVQGRKNVVSVAYRDVTLPSPEQVDIRQELQALREILSRLPSDNSRRIDNRLEEAIDEAARDEPNKDDIGAALEGAIKYAKRADEFSAVAEKLIPRITQVCGWLGRQGTPLLDLLGLKG